MSPEIMLPACRFWSFWSLISPGFLHLLDPGFLWTWQIATIIHYLALPLLACPSISKACDMMFFRGEKHVDTTSEPVCQKCRPDAREPLADSTWKDGTTTTTTTTTTTRTTTTYHHQTNYTRNLSMKVSKFGSCSFPTGSFLIFCLAVAKLFEPTRRKNNCSGSGQIR